MIEFKRYMGNLLKGKKFHFKCDCIIKLDVIGKVVDYEISGQELVLKVDTGGKIISIGENHPKLNIEEIK